MPQELKQVNGRWVVTGDLRSSDLVPKAPAERIKPVAVKPKPSKAKPRKPWWAQVVNDLQYEANQLRTNPLRSLDRATSTAMRALPTGILLKQGTLGFAGANDNLARLGYSAVQRMQGRKKADPSAGRYGEFLDRKIDNTYRFLGATPPSQMTPEQREGDQFRRAVVGNFMAEGATGKMQAALQATTLLGRTLRGGAAFALNEALATAFEDNTGGNPVNALNMIPGVNLPGAVNVGQDDMLDAFLKSVGPNAAAGLALGGAVGGAVGGFRNIRRNIRAQRAVQREAQERAKQEAMGFIQKDDADGYGFTPQAMEPPEPVAAPTPQRTPAEEFQQANAAMEERLGMRPAAEAEPAPAAAPEAPDAPATAPGASTPAPAAAPTRSLAEVLGYAPDPRVVGRPDVYSDVQKWLQQREAAADPETAAYEQWLERNQQIRGIPSRQMEMGGPVRNPDQPLPEADPTINYWDYDPSLPESTALGRSISELSDQELLTVANNPGLPVVERVNQVIEARGAIDAPPPLSAQMVMAPTDRLADDYLERMNRALEAREDYQLRPLFDPEANPDLWRRAQAISGVDDPSQLSKADMLDTFRALQGEGQAPIANRLMGAQMMPTADIAAAPKVFQYKGGVDEQGQQIGNSLEGLERWDPAAEGIPQVWRDAAGEIGPAGQTYVVNGHNRLAAAQRMGIPSLRVEFLDAATAAEARLLGAVANVSAGSGTVFDAAKLAREYNISDPAQLKALGKPGASGFWKDGIALGRLPEDVFTAAVNDQISVGKAAIIGGSGADEETMRSAYRYLVQQGPDNVTEGRLRQMMAMAVRSPAASSADQPDLLTGTEWGQQFNAGMLAKADLAQAVEQMLKREKKLFGTVGRQAGQIERVGQVDAGAAKEISSEASRAFTLFDQMKFESGPIGDLLNENAPRVLAGESAGEVAKSLKNRLAAEIKRLMGEEVGPVTDVVQEDMFAAAGRAADAPEEPMAAPQQPVDLTPEERIATEAQVLHQATSGGEVRPPGTPMPELPEPAQVRLDEIDPDAPITPGSKTAQAVADEVRLAIEHKRMDAAMGWEQEQAVRDGTNYHDLTYDQKQEIRNAVAGVPDVRPVKEMPPANTKAGKDIRKKISNLEELISNSRDVRLPAARERGNTEVAQQLEASIPKWEKQLADLQAEYGIEPALAPAPARPEPLRLTESAQQPELLLPQDLSRSSPRYGRYTVAFESDLDRAAYVLANDAVRPSKAAPKFRQVVKEAGLDLDAVVAHGKRVKAALKQAAKEGAVGGQLELPAQPWRDGGPIDEMSVEGRDIIDIRELDDITDAGVRARRQAAALKIIRQVAGPEVEVRFEDEYLKKIKGPEWGGDGKAMTLQGGFYRFSEDLIMVRGVLRGSDQDVAEAAFHESFHRLQYMAFGDKEAAVLNSAWARIKTAVGANHVMGAPRSGKPIAYSETQAAAFQRYAEARRNGQDPVVAMLGGYEAKTPVVEKALIRVVAAFDRIADIVEKLVNRFTLGTFDSTRGIFEKARRGALVEQADYAFAEPMSGFEMMTRGKGWRSTSYDWQEIQRTQRQIEANNQAMDDIRRKAQQEGC